VRREIGRGKDWFKIRVLITDKGRSQAVLDFLSTTGVGRLVPVPAGEDAQREELEWELREWRGKKERDEYFGGGFPVSPPFFFLGTRLDVGRVAGSYKRAAYRLIEVGVGRWSGTGQFVIAMI